MNKVLAVIFSSAFLLVSVPAFACGGDKQAKSDADETVMTAEASETDEAADTKKSDETETKETKDGEV